MTSAVSRTKLIQIWFLAAAMAFAWGVVLGTSVTASTGALLLALCLVPPLILSHMWHAAPAPTIADVLHGGDGRV
jgi:hypothetical protein